MEKKQYLDEEKLEIYHGLLMNKMDEKIEAKSQEDENEVYVFYGGTAEEVLPE